MKGSFKIFIAARTGSWRTTLNKTKDEPIQIKSWTKNLNKTYRNNWS